MFFALSKSVYVDSQNWIKRPITISISLSRCQNPNRNFQHLPKPQSGFTRTWIFFAHSKPIKIDKIYTFGLSETTTHIKVMLKNLQCPKGPLQDLKDIDILYTFKIITDGPNLGYGPIKDQWPYPNHDQATQLKSETFSILQSQNQDLKGYGSSLQLQNQ